LEVIISSAPGMCGMWGCGQVAVLADEMHAVGTGDQAAVLDDLDARLFEIDRVGLLEPGDFLFLGRHQGWPVERGIDLPAEAGGNVEQVVETGGIDIELLGHATADDAGAADAEFLDDGDPGAIGGSHTGRPHTAGTGADDDEVVAIAHWENSTRRRLHRHLTMNIGWRIA
jgi:hypothetical protein